MQQLVRDGLLSLGQAKALAGLADRDLQAVLAKRAAAEGWSVRQVEAAVRKAGDGAADTGSKAPTTGRADSRPALLRDLEEQIGRQLQTKVRVRSGRKKGTGSITIEFYSLDQFDSLLARLGVETE
ncbi:MAG: hypothetical protein V3U29_02335 [Phycisphaeraceae bacterium]